MVAVVFGAGQGMDIRAILMGLAFAVMWSSAFTSARIIVASAPPLTALSLRFFISGLLGVLIARALGQSWQLTRGQWRATVIFGLCQNTLYLGLNFVAMQTIEAGLAAIIASTMPLLVGLAGWLIFRERIGWMGMLGPVAGVIALTFATLAVRGATSGGNFLMIVGLQMLVGSAGLAVGAVAMETIEVTWSWQLIAAFAYTTLVPGLAATLVWFWLVNRIGATKAATFHFLNPFLGVAIAALILSETLSAQDLIGVAVIMGGILAVQLSRQRRV